MFENVKCQMSKKLDIRHYTDQVSVWLLQVMVGWAYVKQLSLAHTGYNTISFTFTNKVKPCL